MGHFDDFNFFIFLFCCFNVPFKIVYLSGKRVGFQNFLKNFKKSVGNFLNLAGFPPLFLS